MKTSIKITMNSYTTPFPTIKPYYNINVYTNTPLYQNRDVSHWLELGMGKQYNQCFNKMDFNKKDDSSYFNRIHYDDIENHSQR